MATFTNTDYQKWLKAHGYTSRSAAPEGSYEKAKADFEATDKKAKADKDVKKAEKKAKASEKPAWAAQKEKEYANNVPGLTASSQAAYAPKEGGLLDKAGKGASKPTQAPEQSEIDVLHDKLLHAKCSDDDLRRIKELYDKGEWKWALGPKTKAAMQELGLIKPVAAPDPKPTQAPDPKLTGGLEAGPAPAPKSSVLPSAGFQNWFNKEQKLFYDLVGQVRVSAQAKGQEISEEEARNQARVIMRQMYDQGPNATKDSLRQLQAKYGLSDISGDGRSDSSVARGIQGSWKKGSNGLYSPAGFSLGV